MTDQSPFHIGCAGWSIFSTFADRFPSSGTHLERYAQRFSAVEINSSFYRPHRPQTYAKWATCVPAHFRFAVKVPKTITHERRLKDPTEPMQRFLSEVVELGPKLGPLLVQLPPSLEFAEIVAKDFFAELRDQFAGQIVCEPRHHSWFTSRAEALLVEFQVARVAADPALSSQANIPGGWGDLAYFRLHGSPRIYYSAYSPEFLETLALTLQNAENGSIPTWCIFDNTAEGEATNDALSLMERLGAAPQID